MTEEVIELLGLTGLTVAVVLLSFGAISLGLWLREAWLTIERVESDAPGASVNSKRD